jgi:hypothetical protein
MWCGMCGPFVSVRLSDAHLRWRTHGDASRPAAIWLTGQQVADAPPIHPLASTRLPRASRLPGSGQARSGAAAKTTRFGISHTDGYGRHRSGSPARGHRLRRHWRENSMVDRSEREAALAHRTRDARRCRQQCSSDRDVLRRDAAKEPLRTTGDIKRSSDRSLAAVSAVTPSRAASLHSSHRGPSRPGSRRGCPR